MGEPGQDSMIRFGVFELDTRSGQLRKAGIRIRLQDQPLKVLIALLEQPGDVLPGKSICVTNLPSNGMDVKSQFFIIHCLSGFALQMDIPVCADSRPMFLTYPRWVHTAQTYAYISLGDGCRSLPTQDPGIEIEFNELCL
jgi:hypothetical protein